MPDFDLDRFVAAQDPVYGRVLGELRQGRKTSHWMWFVFPQIEGLGRSGTARYFAIRSGAEARAYLAHPVLGARLRECTQILNTLEGRTAEEVFGAVDAIKLKSSMTLFEAVAGAGEPFAACLAQYFGGARDEQTLARLS